MPQEVVDKLKKFRFRKEKNIAAIMCKLKLISVQKSDLNLTKCSFDLYHLFFFYIFDMLTIHLLFSVKVEKKTMKIIIEEEFDVSLPTLILVFDKL